MLSDLIIRNYSRRGELQGGRGRGTFQPKCPPGCCMAPMWRPLQETPENLLRIMTKTLKGLHSPDLNLMELHGMHPKHAAPWSVVGLRGFTQEDQAQGSHWNTVPQP